MNWRDLGLADSSATATDLWTGKELGAFPSSYSAVVPAGDALLLAVRGSEGKRTHYTAAGAGGKSIERVGVPVIRDRPVSFNHVASRARMAQIQIVYSNPDKAPRFAELRVNGQVATGIAFPSTGSGTGMIWIQALLDRTGARNVLSFSTRGDPGPSLESISLQ